MAPHVTNNSGDPEWYTPPNILQAVRNVFPIELDPASSHEAQKLVQAQRYYTQDEDGLQQPWQGSVYLNPPYKASLVRAFIDKLLSHFPHDVTQAIVLTNNATDTRWWQTFCYLGVNNHTFEEHFEQFGLVLVKGQLEGNDTQ